MNKNKVVVVSRCAECGKMAKTYQFGLCEECLKKRFEELKFLYISIQELRGANQCQN